MRSKLLILSICLPFLHGCSWIAQFFVVNQTGIFYYGPLSSYPCNGKDPDWNGEKDIPVDTLEDRSHFTLTLQPNTAVEIGRLQNDKYEKHDQHFINDGVFNLESLLIKQGHKETKITPVNFDDNFKKTNGGVYYFVR